MIQKKIRMIGLVLGALALSPVSVLAQDTAMETPSAVDAPATEQPAVPAADTVAADTEAATPAAPKTIYEGGIDPNEIMPIVFSYWERAAINDARNSRGLVRPPTEEELMRDLKNDQKVRPPPEEREISLGGIVYVSGGEWTIWLNGKRVTPAAIPSEVLDLKVYKEYVEMKWFDDYTNQIFPVRLRSHQRFNIDMRIFLPG
jgi:hypothetical protein